MGSPLAKHVPEVDIKLKVGNPLANHVVLENTTISKDKLLNPIVPCAVLVNIRRLPEELPIAIKVVLLASTKRRDN